MISLALESLGNRSSKLYDGSWTEWGSASDTPVRPGAATRPEPMMRLIRTRVTSLAMTARPANLSPVPFGAGTVAVVEAKLMPLAEYRALYRRIGEAHHWTSRLLSDERLKREIHDRDTRIFVMSVDGRTSRLVRTRQSPGNP